MILLLSSCNKYSPFSMSKLSNNGVGVGVGVGVDVGVAVGVGSTNLGAK